MMPVKPLIQFIKKSISGILSALEANIFKKKVETKYLLIRVPDINAVKIPIKKRIILLSTSKDLIHWWLCYQHIIVVPY